MVYQYSETNVMHFLFNLLGIKDRNMFRAFLLILRRRCTNGTWYIACVLSVGCTTRNIPSAVCVAPPEDEQILLTTVAYPGLVLGEGGVQQIQLRTEGRENGDLGAVAP
jgi:hypothetical protein